MHADDEFFSFTLVTIHARVEGPRIVLVHLVTKTTVKMLENSGAPHIPADKLPEHMRRAINDYEATRIQKAMNRMDAMFKLREPSERTIQ